MLNSPIPDDEDVKIPLEICKAALKKIERNIRYGKRRQSRYKILKYNPPAQQGKAEALYLIKHAIYELAIKRIVKAQEE